MKHILPAWLDSLSRDGGFIVVGRAGMDLYPTPAGTKISSATTFSSDVGGSAGNIAVALARAGQKVELLSSLSSDAIGDFVAENLKNFGVGLTYIDRTTGLQRTSLAIAEALADAPEVVIYRNNASDLILNSSYITNLPLAVSKAIIFTGTALSSKQANQQLRQLAQDANAHQCPVILDIDYREMAWPSQNQARAVLSEFCDYVDLLVGNDEEFAMLSGGSISDGKSYALKFAADDRVALYKAGSAGCDIFSRHISEHISIYKVTPLKPFGAGDAFLGNVMGHLVYEQNWVEAIKAGAAAAAMVISRQGCASAMPDKQSLIKFQSETKFGL